MIVEKIMFHVVAFSLFIFMFFKMIRKNDTNYVIILCLQALGIAIRFLEIVFTWQLGIFAMVLTYIISIVLPVVIFLIEYKKINFSEWVYIVLSQIALWCQNPKMAKNRLIKLVSKYPESYLGHKMLAKLYEKEGGMRKAIDEYVHVIDLDKQDYDSYYRISFLLKELDKKEEATQMLENLLRKKPDMLQATELLGDLYCEQDRYKEAANLYSDALKYHPASYELYYNMGIVYTMLNDFQNAKICYEKAAAINTLSYQSYYQLAQISFIYNDLEEAEKYFMKALEDDELEPKAYYQLAKIYMIRGDQENAIRFLNIAIEMDAVIYKKAEAEPIFIPIKAYMKFPDFEEEEKKKETWNSKEKKMQKHMEETMKLVRKLSRNEQKMDPKRWEKEQFRSKEREE